MTVDRREKEKKGSFLSLFGLGLGALLRERCKSFEESAVRERKHR